MIPGTGLWWRLPIGVMLAALPVICGCTRTFKQYGAEGERLLGEERYAAARAQFLAAQEMVPENADTLCNLGQCQLGIAREYMLRGDRLAANRELDRAIAYYRRAIQSYPGYRKAHHGLNQALEMRGRPEQALASAEWASSVVGPAVRQQLDLAREYAERGDDDRALLAYRQAVAMEPANPVPHRALGEFFLSINRPAEGIESLQQAYRLDPTRTDIADRLRNLNAEVPDVSALTAG